MQKANGAARVGRGLGAGRLELERRDGCGRAEETAACQMRGAPHARILVSTTDCSSISSTPMSSIEPTPITDNSHPVLARDLAGTVAYAGVDPTLEGRAL